MVIKTSVLPESSKLTCSASSQLYTRMPPHPLVGSCDEYTEYPHNLKHNEPIRPYVLRSLRDKLSEESATRRLFCEDGLAKLHLMRFDRAQGQISESQFTNLRSLRRELSCDTSQNKDLLLCQFTFIEAYTARDVLDVSKEMMLWILSLFQVMPNFLEFVFPFGEQLYDHDFQFSAFRQDIRISGSSSRGDYPEFLRSGKDFQLCYNLKSIELKPEDDWQWSARQAAVFNSFDLRTGQANWIIIKAKGNLRERLREALKKALEDDPSMYTELSTKFANTLMCHLVVVDWCAESWRWYIKYLEKQLEANTSRALLFRPTGILSKDDFTSTRAPPSAPQHLLYRGTTWNVFRTNTSRSAPQPSINLQPTPTLAQAATRVYEEPDQLPPEIGDDDAASTAVGSKSGIQIDELQNAQYLETKAGEAALILKSNISILCSLKHHYEDVGAEISRAPVSPQLSQEFKTAAQVHISTFARHLRQAKADLESHLARIETTSKLASDRKTLLYELVDYQNMQANESFARKSVASAKRMEEMTGDMQTLTRKTALETVLMRIITVVTVLFLPATFVSTMMSANIIDFKPKDSSISAGTTSLGALKFFLCLTFALMAGTFGTGFGFFAWELTHSSRESVVDPTGP